MGPVRNRRGVRVAVLPVLHLGQLLAQVLQGPPEEARDVHLAHADAVRDLRLRLALVEPELEDLLLLLPEPVHGPLKEDLVLQPLNRRVVVGLEVHDRVALALVGAHGGVEARGVVGPPKGQGLGDALLVGLQDRRELPDRGRASVLDGLVADGLLGRLAQLLQPARHAHRPALIPEVALDLPEDVRRRVGRELDPAVHVEAVDRLDEPHGGDLHQVVHGLPAPGELAGEELRQGQLLLDHLLPRGLVAVLVVPRQQTPGPRLVRPPVSPAQETSSTTVRQRSPPSSKGSSTSARTPSSASANRNLVGTSSEWKSSSRETASSSPPTPTFARAAMPAITSPTHERSSPRGGRVRYAYCWSPSRVKRLPPLSKDDRLLFSSRGPRAAQRPSPRRAPLSRPAPRSRGGRPARSGPCRAVRARAVSPPCANEKPPWPPTPRSRSGGGRSSAGRAPASAGSCGPPRSWRRSCPLPPG